MSASVVDAVLGGDRDAFRRLVERESRGRDRRVHADPRRSRRGRGRRPGGVRDRVPVARVRGASDGPFGAWLSRIAVRLAIRRAAQRKQVVWLDPVSDGDAAAATASRDRRRDGDPAHSVLRSERDAELRAAVVALDEPYREVVALRFFAERSLAEIAAVDRPAARHREDPPPPRPGAAAPRRRGVGPMTAPRAFGPGELDGAEGLRVDDVAAETRIARDLEAMTSQAAALPSPDFTDRVMLAIDARAAAGARACRRRARSAAGPSAPSSPRSATRGASRRAVRVPDGGPGPGARARPRGRRARRRLRGRGGRCRRAHPRRPAPPPPAPSLEAPTPVVPSPSPSMAAPSVEPPDDRAPVRRADRRAPDRAAGAHRAPDRLRRQPRRWKRRRQRERWRRWRRGRRRRPRRSRRQADPEADQRLRSVGRRGRERRRRWQQRQRQRRQRWRRLLRSRRIGHGRRRRVDVARRPDAPDG